LPRIANFLNSSHMGSLRSDSIAGGARHRSGRHQPVRPARTITNTMRIRTLRPAVTDAPIYTLRKRTNTRFMARRTSRASPSPRDSDATRRTDRHSGVGMEGNATTGPFANLLARLCKRADAECMCNALVPASWAWSPSEVAAAAVVRTPGRMQRLQAPPKRPDFVAVCGAAATSRRNPL
jgi:hypothetical protein